MNKGDANHKKEKSCSFAIYVKGTSGNWGTVLLFMLLVEHQTVKWCWCWECFPFTHRKSFRQLHHSGTFI